ncbi:hypothetical protein [Chenggangzhangella methanolivorans]|uniref:Uncharacterized protein n=1 Tax=Chenggangzhangella methanolivorans TaxID=1437009 RepID=A0A9E6RDH4_9HYPH|nr:hypothetical protein [Chenggangzhangella methanolivorans]QZO01318.1 hypothetical protein K6K41_07425 [Chenggangzhangella methanolivorans]
MARVAFEAGPALGTPRLSVGRRWALTLAATAASTYALDAVATAAGAGLAASRVLAAAGIGPLLALLAASYVVWALGLRVAIAANWTLLETTGASSNALSKAAYDVAQARSRNLLLRRRAAAAGYVAMEVAKEAPYYAGAFGAALVVEELTARDALAFLIGSNFGAAAYECALGQTIRRFLPAGADGLLPSKPRSALADEIAATTRRADERTVASS